MAKDKGGDKPAKPTSIAKVHKDDKSLDRAGDRTQKPKGKVEKALRAWADDVDSEG
jgi:hypothetical protein